MVHLTEGVQRLLKPQRIQHPVDRGAKDNEWLRFLNNLESWLEHPKSRRFRWTGFLRFQPHFSRNNSRPKKQHNTCVLSEEAGGWDLRSGTLPSVLLWQVMRVFLAHESPLCSGESK